MQAPQHQQPAVRTGGEASAAADAAMTDLKASFKRELSFTRLCEVEQSKTLTPALKKSRTPANNTAAATSAAASSSTSGAAPSSTASFNLRHRVSFGDLETVRYDKKDSASSLTLGVTISSPDFRYNRGSGSVGSSGSRQNFRWGEQSSQPAQSSSSSNARWNSLGLGHHPAVPSNSRWGSSGPAPPQQQNMFLRRMASTNSFRRMPSSSAMSAAAPSTTTPATAARFVNDAATSSSNDMVIPMFRMGSAPTPSSPTFSSPTNRRRLVSPAAGHYNSNRPYDPNANNFHNQLQRADVPQPVHRVPSFHDSNSSCFAAAATTSFERTPRLPSRAASPVAMGDDSDANRRDDATTPNAARNFHAPPRLPSRRSSITHASTSTESTTS